MKNQSISVFARERGECASIPSSIPSQISANRYGTIVERVGVTPVETPVPPLLENESYKHKTYFVVEGQGHK